MYWESERSEGGQEGPAMRNGNGYDTSGWGCFGCTLLLRRWLGLGESAWALVGPKAGSTTCEWWELGPMFFEPPFLLYKMGGGVTPSCRIVIRGPMCPVTAQNDHCLSGGRDDHRQLDFAMHPWNNASCHTCCHVTTSCSPLKTLYSSLRTVSQVLCPQPSFLTTWNM